MILFKRKTALYLLCKGNTKPLIMQLISLMIYDLSLFFCLVVSMMEVIILRNSIQSVFKDSYCFSVKYSVLYNNSNQNDVSFVSF